MPTRRAFLGGAVLAAAANLKAQSSHAGQVVRAVVTLDGSGDFPTIQRAVDHVLDHPPQDVARVILDIRPGLYRERIKVPREDVRFTFAGRDAATTIISASMSAAAAGGTFFSSIVEIDADDFEATGITFENSFGVGSQAVAIALHSDRTRFHNCRFSGWQDTLYAARGRQYYRDCYIEGHVDFIFGDAAAVFEGCEIHSRGSGYIAAVNRTSPEEPTGFVFRHCRLTAPPGLRRTGQAPPAAPEAPFPPEDSGKGVYLGRPWRDYARTVYLDCAMGDHIRPEGWDNWGIPAREKTAWFGEAGSTGPGADPGARVAWAHKVTPEIAAGFAPEVFLKGTDGWNPSADRRG